MQETRQPSATRSAFGGLCTLLALSLLIGASLSGTEPAIELSRSGAHQRHAVRHMTQTVARAVRSLMGDQTKPGVPARAARPGADCTSVYAMVRGSQHESRSIEPLRAELLSIPPPASRG